MGSPTRTSFTRRAIATFLAAGIVLSACGEPEMEFGQTKSESNAAVCHGQVGLLGLAGDLFGLVPGLGALGRLAMTATKVSNRLACGGAGGYVALSIDDVHKAISDADRDAFQTQVNALMNRVKTPLTLSDTDLGDRINDIRNIETAGTRVGWASLHTKAELAAVKYALMLIKLGKTKSGTLRAAAVTEVKTELQNSIRELDRTEQEYLTWADNNTTATVRETGKAGDKYFYGRAQLDDISRENESYSWCGNIFGACKKKKDEAQGYAEQMRPLVKDLHRRRVFTSEYQKLRTRLDAAYKQFEYRSPRNECRIKNYWRDTYLRYTTNSLQLGTPGQDPTQASFYETQWFVEETTTPGTVTLRSGFYFNDAGLVSRMLGVDTTGSTPRWETYSESARTGKWTLEKVTGYWRPAGNPDIYRLRPLDRPTDALHAERTHVEVGAAGPGWWSAFWTFEGDCGRILKSDGTTEDEDLELDALADAKGIVTRIRNVGRPNLEMGVELVNNIATLVLEDMSTSPEVDVFHFTPVTSSDRTYNNMRLQHTLYPNQYVLPGQSNTLELGTLSNPSMLGFAVHRITDNVFVIYDRHTSRFVRAGEGVLELTHVYDENSKWRLEDVDRNYGRVGIEMPAFGKCLNVGSGAHGTQVTLWDCIDSGVGRANQEFEFIEEGEGSFRIFHPASGRCLNVRGGGMGDFTPLELANCVGVRPIQLFEMRFQPNTYAKPSFEVRSNLSGRCINLPYGRTHNGQGMHLMQCVGSSDQGPAHPFNLFTLRFR